MEQETQRARLQATRRFYAECYRGLAGESPMMNHIATVAGMLDRLAQALNYPLNDTIHEAYRVALVGLDAEELVTGFARAHLELRMFPSPAQLLELCGHREPSQSEDDEAARQLVFLYARIRQGFRMLKPYRPRVEKANEPGVYVDSDRVLDPALSERQKLAIMLVGFGSFKAGVELLRSHSSIAGRAEDSSRVDRDVELRWARAWRENSNPFWDKYRRESGE